MLNKKIVLQIDGNTRGLMFPFSEELMDQLLAAETVYGPASFSSGVSLDTPRLNFTVSVVASSDVATRNTEAER